MGSQKIALNSFHIIDPLARCVCVCVYVCVCVCACVWRGVGVKKMKSAQNAMGSLKFECPYLQEYLPYLSEMLTP